MKLNLYIYPNPQDTQNALQKTNRAIVCYRIGFLSWLP